MANFTNIANLRGPQGIPGADGQDGLDGSNVLPTDEAIAQALDTPGSESREAADARYLPFSGRRASGQGDLFVRVQDYLDPARVAGTTDDSPAILAAQSMASSLALTAGGRVTLLFPPGKVYAHELAWDDITPWKGQGFGLSRIVYNGLGGPGSYLIGNAKNGGATPWGGFEGLGLYGWENGRTAIAEHAYRVTGTTEPDFGFKWHDLIIANFAGDALDFGTGLVNLHLDRVRWDGIGGHALHVRQKVTDANRPLTVERFSLDNVISSQFETALQAAGYSTETWGRGLINADPGSDILIKVSSGRVEFNRPIKMHGGRKSLIYAANPNSGRYISVQIDNVGVSQQSRDALVGVWAPQGRTSVFITASSLGAGLNFEDGTSITRNLPGSVIGYAATLANAQNDQGMFLSGSRIETRAGRPSSSATFVDYQAGDIILDRSVSPGQKGVGAVVVAPATGRGSAITAVITTGSMIAGSQLLTPTSNANLFRFPAGNAIRVVGAGAGGADLLGVITSVDADAGVVSLSVPAATSVTGANVFRQPIELRDFGDLVTYGTAAPTTGSWGRGEKRYNTQPSAGGFVGWVCVTAGTPGTWKGFGAIEA